jgi:hypothetical protein
VKTSSIAIVTALSVLPCHPIQALANDRLMAINVHDNAHNGRIYRIGVGDHIVYPGLFEGFIIEVTLTGNEKVQTIDGTIIPVPDLVAAYLVSNTAKADNYQNQAADTTESIIEQAARDRAAQR